MRQNSLDVTACIVAIATLSDGSVLLNTPHFCDAPDVATRLLGDYRDWTCTS